MSRLALDVKELEGLEERIRQFGDGAEDVVNGVLHDFGVKQVEENIQRILPTSGRKWKGKAKAAKSAQPFRDETGNLTFVVKSKPKYRYLYFPDDGSNTRKHAGNQHFMLRGAEASKKAILDRCVAALTADF